MIKIQYPIIKFKLNFIFFFSFKPLIKIGYYTYLKLLKINGIFNESNMLKESYKELISIGATKISRTVNKRKNRCELCPFGCLTCTINQNKSEKFFKDPYIKSISDFFLIECESCHPPFILDEKFKKCKLCSETNSF